MSDAALASMLIHRVNVYHLDVTVDASLQQTEGYPDRWSPDVADLPCLFVTDGKTLGESEVGYVIESDAILYCEAADIRERDRIHFGGRVYYVNAKPSETYNPWGTGNPNTPHVLSVGLKQDKTAPGSTP